ncbi:SLBB domain-containing protein [Roseibacillus ishigakijimensis]|uniref:SLBB domain-containing protein n=1 Tax=Roseibacillus ishigakijimensis TaxID=454146 RepID=A0A934RQA5_9BACT|nr:SLBB domain-containing protein [Roseibacillus ishigakijimensis]MBK1833636.1 SLBB domain-containing protein [Roseibacillus ishigakijimensis]
MKTLIFFFSFMMGLPLSLLGQDSNGEAYLLKGNDEVRLNVFGEPDMSREVRLTATGEASLPLLGSVKLGGMSLGAAEERVAELYRGDYLVEPRISINLLNAASERVMVMGAVLNPGSVEIPANTTLDLVSALGSAGGFTAQAQPEKIELVRGSQSFVYGFAQLGAADSNPIMLKHGDIINVPTNPFVNKSVTIVGEVEAPGERPYPTSGTLELQTLIGLAQGVTEEADVNLIKLKRADRVIRLSLPSDSAFPILPGDVVTVAESQYVDEFVTILGEVGRPGPVAFPKDGKLDLLTALSLAGGFDRLANKKRVVVSRQVNGVSKAVRLDVAEMEEGQTGLFFLQPGDTVTIPVRRF